MQLRNRHLRLTTALTVGELPGGEAVQGMAFAGGQQDHPGPVQRGKGDRRLSGPGWQARQDGPQAMAHHPGWNLAPGLPSGMHQDDASAARR